MCKCLKWKRNKNKGWPKNSEERKELEKKCKKMNKVKEAQKFPEKIKMKIFLKKRKIGKMKKRKK